jgi:RsiW-degrading membrane proteinase PrsW (M82 family)
MTFELYMTFYLFGAGVYCIVLLFNRFKYQKGLKKNPISWLIIFMASSFWLIVIPISLLEILTNSKEFPPSHKS